MQQLQWFLLLSLEQKTIQCKQKGPIYRSFLFAYTGHMPYNLVFWRYSHSTACKGAHDKNRHNNISPINTEKYVRCAVMWTVLVLLFFILYSSLSLMNHIRFYGQLRYIPREKYAQIKQLFADFEIYEQKNAMDFEYEGVYIDHEIYLDAILDILGTEANGQADLIDLIEWKMYRYVIDKGTIVKHDIPLNNVLEKYNME